VSTQPIHKAIHKQVWKSARRKRANALAVVEAGQGIIKINRIPIELIQPEAARFLVMTPIKLAGDLIKCVNVDVKARGGGFMGQASASAVAISRALTRWFSDYMPQVGRELHKRFMEYDERLLKGDHRQKEPKKSPRRGARAMPQKSYR
jgi:small subunit ribosomal protein S9